MKSGTLSHKTPALISTILTIVLLVLFAVLSILTQMLALNGASERQGITAMGISLACQGVGVILAGILSWRLTHIAMRKFNWSGILAVAVSVTAGVLFGAAVSFLSVIISIPLAGIR